MTTRARDPFLLPLAVFYAAAVALVGTVVYHAPMDRLMAVIAVSLFAVAGITSVRIRSDDQTVLVFVLVGIFATGTWLLYPFPPSYSGSPLELVFAALHRLVFFLMSSLMFHLCLRMAGDSPVARARPELARHAHAAMAVAALLAVLLQLNGHHRWIAALPDAASVNGWVRLGILACYAISTIVGSGLVAHAALRSESLDRRRQAVALCAAFFPFGVLRLGGALIPQLQSTESYLALEWAVTVILPLGLFIAVNGLRLFGVRSLPGRGLVSLLSLGLLLGAGYVVILTGALMLRPIVPMQWTAVLACGIALLVLRPVLRDLGSLADTVLYPERVAIRRLGHEILDETAQFTDLRELTGAVAASVRHALGLDAAAVYVDEGAGEYELAGSAGSARLPRLLHGPQSTRSSDPVFRHVLPIEFRGRTNALLALGSRTQDEPLTPVELRELADVTLQIAASIESARLFRLATRDPLTGLLRRSVFEERLIHQVAEFSRGGAGFSVAMIDIDNFKRINDSHGHQAGDQVLREVAATVAARVRDSDTAARYGGEELVVLLPGAGTGVATAVAETLRAGVAALEHDNFGKVTVSIGVAAMLADSSAADVVARADAALYRAKARGKNRVEANGEGAADTARA